MYICTFVILIVLRFSSFYVKRRIINIRLLLFLLFLLLLKIIIIKLNYY